MRGIAGRLEGHVIRDDMIMSAEQLSRLVGDTLHLARNKRQIVQILLTAHQQKGKAFALLIEAGQRIQQTRLYRRQAISFFFGNTGENGRVSGSIRLQVLPGKLGAGQNNRIWLIKEKRDYTGNPFIKHCMVRINPETYNAFFLTASRKKTVILSLLRGHVRFR